MSGPCTTRRVTITGPGLSLVFAMNDHGREYALDPKQIREVASDLADKIMLAINRLPGWPTPLSDLKVESTWLAD